MNKTLKACMLVLLSALLVLNCGVLAEENHHVQTDYQTEEELIQEVLATVMLEAGNSDCEHQFRYGSCECTQGCGAEIHQDIKTSFELKNISGYEKFDDKFHLATGDYMLEIYCGWCDAVLMEQTALDQRTMKEEHSGGSECRQCGEINFECDWNSCIGNEDCICINCGKEAHTFEKNSCVCTVCGKIEHWYYSSTYCFNCERCDQADHTESERPRMFFKNASYTFIDNDYHYVEGTAYLAYYCTNCRVMMREREELGPNSAIEEHELESIGSGNYQCRGCQIILTFDGSCYGGCNSGTYTKEVKEYGSYEPVIAEKTHTLTYDVVEITYCRKCDKELGREVLQKGLTETAAHWNQIANDGNFETCCYYCGYAPECLHLNASQKIFDQSGLFYEQIDAEKHLKKGMIAYVDYCPDCGLWLVSEISVQSGGGGGSNPWMDDGAGTKQYREIEEPHNYVNNICKDCGRDKYEGVAPGTILLNADELYAVKGMRIPLEAEVHLAGNAEFEYESSAERVAVVNGDGVIETVGYGDAIITVSAKGSDSVECKIHVLEAIVLPDDASLIGDSAFEGSSIMAVDLSGNDGLRIGEETFADCENLKCVLLPENVEFGKGIFDASSDVMLYCRNEQQARYAQDNGIDWLMIG